MRRTFSVIVEATENGMYIGHVAGIPECMMQGETVEGLLLRIRAALEEYVVAEPDVEPVFVVGVREIVL